MKYAMLIFLSFFVCFLAGFFCVAQAMKSDRDGCTYNQQSKKLRNKNLGNLWRAARGGDVNVVIEYIHNGGNVNIRDRRNKTLLHWSAGTGSRAIVTFLLKRKIDVNIRDSDGTTALGWAVKYPKIVAMLLEAGAKIDVPNKQGKTALTWAVMNGQAETADLLLEHKADVNVQDRERKRTPLHWVLRMGKGSVQKKSDQLSSEKILAVMKVLLKYDADVTLTDYKEKTPLYWAESHGWQEETCLLCNALQSSKKSVESSIVPSSSQNVRWADIVKGRK